MRSKIVRLITVGLCISLCILSGCQLALENAEGQSTGRLIGLFITKEPLDLSGEGRVYAKCSEGKWDFAEAEGICYFIPELINENQDLCTELTFDDAIWPGHTEIKTTDDGQEITLEASLYFPPGGQEEFFMNPVYQEADERVYVMKGNGMRMDADGEGSAFTHKLEESQSQTENGESRQQHFSVSLTLETRRVPSLVRVLQMTAAHEIVEQKEYEAGKMPESLTPDTRTEYIVLELITEQGTIHEVLGKEEQEMKSWYLREDGYLVKQYTQLMWK